jgi:glycosyltransferase involved in cell wall biosynthesis
MDIAILIPCYNEALTVEKVITDFQRELPSAEIYVFDNASSDDTAAIARRCGATVFHVNHRGKGYVVQYMYRIIRADIYVMVDGDDTYPAERVHDLLQPVLDKHVDMAVGSRLLLESDSEFKLLNRWGNYFFLGVLNTIFGVRLTDMLSGYRAMNREIVDATPVLSRGFEIETELTIRALQSGFIIQEIPIRLRNRPEGSHSKIRVARDGLRILFTILMLFRDYKPLTFFSIIGGFTLLVGLAIGVGVIQEFLETGLVPRFPTAILSASLVLLSFFLILSGLILDTLNRRFGELHFQVRRFTRDQSADIRTRINRTDYVLLPHDSASSARPPVDQTPGADHPGSSESP